MQYAVWLVMQVYPRRCCDKINVNNNNKHNIFISKINYAYKMLYKI